MTSPKRKPGRPATGETPVRRMRIKDSIWDQFVRAAGGTRKTPRVAEALFAWYARLPGAKLPTRPPADTDDSDD